MALVAAARIPDELPEVRDGIRLAVEQATRRNLDVLHQYGNEYLSLHGGERRGGPMRIAFRFGAVFASALAGCASPHKAVEGGTARLLPNSVTVGFDQAIPRNSYIYGVIEGRVRRERISVTAADCRLGVGTIYFTGGDSPIFYVVLTGEKPKDKIFKELCTSGLPMIDQHFAQPMEAPPPSGHR